MREERLVAQWTWREILKVAFEVLNYQLFELDGHAVSLGKLITGLVFLILGYFLSRRAAKEVDRRVLVRMNVDEHLRYTLRRLIFYSFYALTTLFTLHLLNVPVTIFTVLGGAVAVGIGFGSQNLVNNFISGVLVMLERPIRVGDYIELDGVSGQVQSIGIRSSIVRTGSNAVTVVPNTTFIEKKLTNWTMSGTISCAVRFTVSQLTDLAVLRSVVEEVARAQKMILDQPPASLALSSFADGALVMDMTFSIRAEDFSARSRIESDVRFRLHERLKQVGVVLPSALHQVQLVDLPSRLFQSRDV